MLTTRLTLLTEDALIERVTEGREPVLAETAQRQTALIGRLSELMDRARSAEVTADSQQAQVLLRVPFDGLRAG